MWDDLRFVGFLKKIINVLPRPSFQASTPSVAEGVETFKCCYLVQNKNSSRDLFIQAPRSSAEWVTCTAPPASSAEVVSSILVTRTFVLFSFRGGKHDVCVCVFSSHPFWTSSKFVGRTSRGHTGEGHTGFLIHLPSAVRALIFVARRIQPFL